MAPAWKAVGWRAVACGMNAMGAVTMRALLGRVPLRPVELVNERAGLVSNGGRASFKLLCARDDQVLLIQWPSSPVL